MRVLCQYIAVRSNREDHEPGKFWQSRFQAVRFLDKAALLACAAYVWKNGDWLRLRCLYPFFHTRTNSDCEVFFSVSLLSSTDSAAV